MVAYVLAIHATVLTAAAKFLFDHRGNAKDVLDKVSRCNTLLEKLRFRLVEELRACLRPVFKNKDVVKISSIVDLSGDPWKTESVDPEGSEAFRNAVSNFINGESSTLADYRDLQSSLKCWRCWTDNINMLALGAAAWELAAVTVTGISHQLSANALPPLVLTISLVPTAMAVFGFLMMYGVIMKSDRQITAISTQYV